MKQLFGIAMLSAITFSALVAFATRDAVTLSGIAIVFAALWVIPGTLQCFPDRDDELD